MSAHAWADRLARNLALRRALGFAMQAEERLVHEFVTFLETHGHGDPLAATVAVDWACTTAAHCGPAGQARRLSIARGFLTHVRAAVPEEPPAHNQTPCTEDEVAGPKPRGASFESAPFINFTRIPLAVHTLRTVETLY